ncbi:spermatogenesis-associated protein 6-like isoform X3 [Littorina saxatilis]|uniref:spermatogenesis-associated protein 6-like isoform X3 n=1 Tax=Littorina saxatilis TaxID=31220 RepID=UPI0038B58F21
MPRRAMRCVVDLSLHAVSAPGVWLPSKEDVYISVSMFGQYRNTRLLTSVFPLLIHEKFYFEKTYYTALDPAEVADYLEDELVIIELVQLSEYTDGAVRLGSYSVNVRDFLFPYPSLSPNYSSADREVLLDRTVAFPGISPRLEFASKTVIKESISPAVIALEDALELEAERERRSLRSSLCCSPTRRSRSGRGSPTENVISVPSSIRQEPEPRHCQPTESYVSRYRSVSPSRYRSVSSSRYRSMSPCRYATLDYYDTLASRPPFVVRKLKEDLIGRVPSGFKDGHAKSKRKKTLTYSRSDTSVCSRVCGLCATSMRLHGLYYPGHTKYYHNKSSCCLYCGYVYNCNVCEAYMHCFGHPYTGHVGVHPSYGLRCQCRKSLSRSKSALDDLDAEVAALTSTSPTYSSYRRRPRSASPAVRRSTFRERYTYPHSPTCYSVLSDRVRRRLEEDRRAERMAELDASLRSYQRDRDQTLRTQPLEERRYVFHDKTLDRLRLSPTRSPYHYDPYLDDLDLSTRIARTRSPESLVHVDRDHYGNERPSDNSKKTHREVFTRKVNKTYNRSYRNSRSLGPRKVLV